MNKAIMEMATAIRTSKPHFFKAAEDGLHEEVTRFVDKEYMPVDLKNNDGETALARATVYGHIEIVRLLADRGANLNFKDKWGTTAVGWAVLRGHHKIVSLLADRGADLKDKAERNTLMHSAISRGHDEVVSLLLEMWGDLDLNHKDKKTGMTFLQSASTLHIASCHKIVSLLADRGANLDLADSLGRTPVFLAAMYGHHEVVSVLIKKKANLELTGPCMERKSCGRGHTFTHNPDRQCTPLEVATSKRDFLRDHQQFYPHTGQQRVIDILTEHERLRIARLGLMVGSVTRQKDTSRPVPEVLNTVIMEYL